MKRILSFILLFACILSCLSVGYAEGAAHVQRSDWAPDVMAAINDFIDLYGNTSPNYRENSYVVSDFDNTASIFDMCEQFMIYQAQVMGYGFTPGELPSILSSGLGDMEADLTDLGYGKGSYSDWIADITAAYTHLYDTYGPFTPAGLDEATSLRVQEDPMWAEFTAKVMNLYLLIDDNESSAVSYPWISYLLTGMTEEEVYTLARASFAIYRQVETCERTIRTSADVASAVGVTEYTYVEGIQVTENTRELWEKLDGAGIDVWVCSASQCDIIRAAVDEFDLHDSCTGLIAMTPTRVEGRLSYTYDYDTGFCWYAEADGTWRRGDVNAGAQPQGIGKVTCVENICVAAYGCGPLAGFMDSTGDFNFCTEFGDLKLVICFNRADRKVTDGGSLIAELAIYQREELGYTLATANAAGDTLYVLQGRDENGTRALRSSSCTLKLGQKEERLFRDERNEAIYACIAEEHMTTEDALATFALRTGADNPLGFEYGFLDSYGGYHSR